MSFQDKHAPSILAKLLLSLSILAGIITATVLTSGYSDWLADFLNFKKVEGNIYRQVIMLFCCSIYLVRFTIGMFVFMQRKIGWFEGSLVSVLYFMMFYTFVVSAGSRPEPIGPIDIVGIFMFLVGSYINTMADYQRFAWKRKNENKGRLYTQGLFRYSMHINYFGDAITYTGLALITLKMLCLFISAIIIVNFIVIQIPMLDKHLSKKYGNDFTEYSTVTKKFIPFVY